MFDKIISILKKIFSGRRGIVLGVFLFALSTFFIGNFVYADIGTEIGLFFGNLIGLIINAIGMILAVLIHILIKIASYNDFIKSDAVTYGWVIIRDICNMFFVVVLLVIAFSVILRLEGYKIKDALPKLLIAAVLINFSKSICGLIIDASQLLMGVFVDSFSAMGGANLTEMLGLTSILNFNGGETNMVASGTTIFGAYLLALIYSLIATVVICVLLAVLVVRIVMLWIYIVLSPLAYFLQVFPQGKSYAQTWWKDFTEQVVTGPILAFFIWLSFVSLGSGKAGTEIVGNSSNPNFWDIANTPSASLTSAGSADVLIKFVISIGMLMGGLMIAKKASGATGAAAAWGLGKINSGVKLSKAAVGTGADWLNRNLIAKPTGIDLNLSRQKENLVQHFKRAKQRDLSQIDLRASANLARGGMRGALTGFGARSYGDTYLQGIFGAKGIRQAIWGGVGKVEKLKKRQGEKEDLARIVMSVDEYKNNKHNFEEEYNVAVEEKRKITLEYEEKEKKAKEKMERVKSKDGEDSKNYEEAEKKYKDITAEKNESLTAADNRIGIVDKKLSNLDISREKARNSKLYFTDDKKAKERRKEYQEEATKISQEAASFMVVDYEGQAARRSARSAAGKNIDSENEGELITQFEAAVAKKDEPLAEALLAKLAKIGGSNALLNRYGYQAKSGLTKEERVALDARAAKVGADGEEAAKEIEKEKGFNDFMRDIFGKELKVDEQGIFALQSDIGSIGEQVGKEHLMKTVNVNSAGQYYQVNRKEREEAKLREALKTEAEGNIRKLNRLFYGAENKDTGNFEWSDFGLAMAINNIGIIMKEIKQNRFNKSAARAMAEPEALRRMVEKIKQIGVQNVKDNDGKTVDLEKLQNLIRAYAASASNDNIEKSLS